MLTGRPAFPPTPALMFHLPACTGPKKGVSRSLQYRKKKFNTELGNPETGAYALKTTPQWCVGYRIHRAKSLVTMD